MSIQKKTQNPSTSQREAEADQVIVLLKSAAIHRRYPSRWIVKQVQNSLSAQHARHATFNLPSELIMEELTFLTTGF